MLKLAKVLLVAAVAATAAPAFAADPPLQVTYPTDATLDCGGIATELARMDGVIAQANGATAGADGAQRGAGIAGTVAVEGLMRSGALGRVPGLGMLANGAQNMARQAAETKKAQAAETIRVAGTRKAMLMGMSAGKSCAAS